MSHLRLFYRLSFFPRLPPQALSVVSIKMLSPHNIAEIRLAFINERLSDLGIGRSDLKRRIRKAPCGHENDKQ